MEQLSSGVKVWDNSSSEWIPLTDIYLEEAKQYKWRCFTEKNIHFSMQNVPLFMKKTSHGWEGIFETAFQSGLVNFGILTDEKKETIESFVYPDERKLSTQQYEEMLKEILKEAQIIFQETGLEVDVSASGKTRETSWLQWNYIHNCMQQLRITFYMIEKHPLRRLKQEQTILRREQVKAVDQKMLLWVEQKGEMYGGSPSQFPTYIQSIRKEETYNLYENQVLLAQIDELARLLKWYQQAGNETIQKAAQRYLDWLYHWKKAEFLQGIKPHFGFVNISQVFRKHPMYRTWYQWFQKLYDFKKITFDIGIRLSLKETYFIYEMWVFMKIVSFLRELNLIEDAKGMFTKKENTFYLGLAENKESVIKLKNGATLTYQKIIQSNTSPFYSYTQRMIPDIVLEFKGKLYILDPKYRVPANLPTALGEMHKYRDGILSRTNEEKAVQEVYIITPQKQRSSQEKDFFDVDFHKRYKMGAFCLAPGQDFVGFKGWICRVLGDELYR
ncbi:DUF2357 domain-containing protein [Bacillus cereus]|uniref:DUF2357 domain-containing protein n=1 Tax=Bacillus cereus TaxID=1396 RepID=UPI0035704AD4